MYTRGEYTSGTTTYGVIMWHSKQYTEAVLVVSGTVVSAYKIDDTGSYSYNNNKAKEILYKESFCGFKVGIIDRCMFYSHQSLISSAPSNRPSSGVISITPPSISVFLTTSLIAGI